MKAAIYCRVSTEGQEQEGTSFLIQQGYVRTVHSSRDEHAVVAPATLNRYFSSKWSTRHDAKPPLNKHRDV